MRGADVAKLAVMPGDAADAARLLQATAQAAARRPETPLITMAMGPAGAVTRLCGGAFGVCASFGAMGGAASAPGQPDARDLRAAVKAMARRWGEHGFTGCFFRVGGSPAGGDWQPVVFAFSCPKRKRKGPPFRCGGRRLGLRPQTPRCGHLTTAYSPAWGPVNKEKVLKPFPGNGF